MLARYFSSIIGYVVVVVVVVFVVVVFVVAAAAVVITGHCNWGFVLNPK